MGVPTAEVRLAVIDEARLEAPIAKKDEETKERADRKDPQRQTIPENEQQNMTKTVETAQEQEPSPKTANCTFSGELVPIDLKRFADSAISLVECPRLQEECVRSPFALVSSGSNRTHERRATDTTDRETLVGPRYNGLGRGWRGMNDAHRQSTIELAGLDTPLRSKFADHHASDTAPLSGEKEVSA